MYSFKNQMAYAVRTGMCPICHQRPRARWKDGGGLRVTCGHPACFNAWLPGRHAVAKEVAVAPVAEAEEARL